MDKVAEVISLLQRTSSSNDKKYILKKNEDLPGMKEILKFIFDPYNKTGISKAKLGQIERINVANEEPVTYKEAIRYFKKNQTGTDADLRMAARFINSGNAELAAAIVTQNLQIGVSAKTLNTVYGSHFIPTVGCMLGTKIDDVPSAKIKWPCIVTEKLDGIRRILIKENGVCKMFSRSGHEDTGLLDIMRDAQHLPDNRVYDGELLAKGFYKDSVALRQASNSLSSTKGVKKGLEFNIFDMIPLEDFYKGVSEDNALVRKLLLGATFMDNGISVLGFEEWPMYIASYGMHKELEFIKVVPILGYVKNMLEIEPIVLEIWSKGGEGVMLNTAEGLYETKRSKSLLKVKHVEEHTLKVVDMVEGTNKYEDMLGSLIVEYVVPHKEGFVVYKVGVGSGFTDMQRIVIWENPERYIGRYIEIDSFGESTNNQGTKSLNCPIFKRFVGEVE